MWDVLFDIDNIDLLSAFFLGRTFFSCIASLFLLSIITFVSACYIEDRSNLNILYVVSGFCYVVIFCSLGWFFWLALTGKSDLKSQEQTFLIGTVLGNDIDFRRGYGYLDLGDVRFQVIYGEHPYALQEQVYEAKVGSCVRVTYLTEQLLIIKLEQWRPSRFSGLPLACS